MVHILMSTAIHFCGPEPFRVWLHKLLHYPLPGGVSCSHLWRDCYNRTACTIRLDLQRLVIRLYLNGLNPRSVVVGFSQPQDPCTYKSDSFLLQ